MKRQTIVVWAVAAVMAAAGGVVTIEGASAKKKLKGQRAEVVAGAAGQIAQARSARPLAIDGDATSGAYCAGTTPIVHNLGTVPAGFGVVIDFESDDFSDPIAILTTVKMNGLDVGAEVGASDDEGGDLNPRFELRRPYTATYILAVASADEDEACYTFRTRVLP